jgi:hypothetical protein
LMACSPAQVHPVASLPDKVGHLCPRVLINREPVGLTSDSDSDTETPTAALPSVEGHAGPKKDDEEEDGASGSAANATERDTTDAGFRFSLKDNYRDVYLEVRRAGARPC